MMAKRIETANLSAWFARHPAVEGITLAVEPCEVTALSGYITGRFG